MTKSPNDLHASSLSLAERIGLAITGWVGTLWCVLAFLAIGTAGVWAALRGDTFLTLVVGSVSGYLLQLVLLPLILLGQNAQSRHAELVADADWRLDGDTNERLARIEAALGISNAPAAAHAGQEGMPATEAGSSIGPA